MRFFQGKSCGKAAVFLLAVLVLGLSAGCGTSSKAQNEQLWGRSDAKEIDINSKIAGRVVELTVKEGDTVKKGQVIAMLINVIWKHREINIQQISRPLQRSRGRRLLRPGCKAVRHNQL